MDAPVVDHDALNFEPETEEESSKETSDRAKDVPDHRVKELLKLRTAQKRMKNWPASTHPLREQRVDLMLPSTRQTLCQRSLLNHPCVKPFRGL